MRHLEESLGTANHSTRPISNVISQDDSNYKQHYDVIVVGGGSAGIGAAWGAAKAGASVLIVESEGCLGGDDQPYQSGGRLS